MKHSLAFILSLLLCFSALPISAKLYKYRDQNGVLVFTDDISQLPQQKAKTVETLKEVKQRTQAPIKRQSTIGNKNEGKPSKQETPASLINKYNELTQTKEALKKERQSIIEEKQRLMERRSELKKN